jgi:PAS domain S-box-containing protein
MTTTTASLSEERAAILEMMASGASPEQVLAYLVTTVEANLDGGVCSILRYHPATRTLRHAAAPRLPAAYCSAIDGISVGPDVGSCGSAAYLRQPVTAPDILTDPRWDAFRDIATAHGLRSCFSTPILGPSGDVLGTFAVYRGEVHQPSREELDLLEAFSGLAAIAIRHAITSSLLAESEERFRRIFEDNAGAMALVDEDGRIITTNAAFDALLDVEHGAAGGSAVLDHIDPRDRETVADRLSSVVASRHADYADLGFRVMRGEEPITVVGTLSAVRAADGSLVTLCLSLIDVEARVRHQREQEARKVAETARRAAEAASKSKSDFLAAMSHELRVPLTSIMGYAELLENPQLGEDRRAVAARSISTAARHLLSIVDDVLDLAKIEAGVIDVRLGDVAVGRVVDETTAMLGPLAQRRSVQLVAEEIPAGVSVRGDARRLRQALLNVVSNAIKFNKSGGTVRISVEDDAGSVHIKVSDEGPGIPRPIRKRLFAEFVGTPDASDDAEGNGLGLMVAHQLVTVMGGVLAVDDRPGGGTVADLTLPAGRGGVGTESK